MYRASVGSNWDTRYILVHHFGTVALLECQMEIFISWSGERSKAVAKALRVLLLDIFGRRVTPWLSDSDISMGKRWSSELSAALERAKFGLICVTRINKDSPWLLFEAGAIARSVSESHVCPHLIDLSPVDLQGPLAQFQVTQAGKGSTLVLLKQINNLIKTPVEERKLAHAMEIGWRRFNKQLAQARSRAETEPSEDVRRELAQFLRRLNTYEDFSALFQPAPFDRLASKRRRR